MFRKFWLPIILKSVVLTEAITGLDGPSKKAKAGALATAFALLLGEGLTNSDKEEIDNMIDGTVDVLNKEGVFPGHELEDEIEEVTEEEQAEKDVGMRHTGFAPAKEPETIGEDKKEESEEEGEPELVWPLTRYDEETYLNRWPNGPYADLARELLGQTE